MIFRILSNNGGSLTSSSLSIRLGGLGGERESMAPIGSMNRAWNLLRKGGSIGYPVYGGTGAAMATTLKFLCAGTNCLSEPWPLTGDSMSACRNGCTMWVPSSRFLRTMSGDPQTLRASYISQFSKRLFRSLNSRRQLDVFRHFKDLQALCPSLLSLSLLLSKFDHV